MRGESGPVTTRSMTAEERERMGVGPGSAGAPGAVSRPVGIGGEGSDIGPSDLDPTCDCGGCESCALWQAAWDTGDARLRRMDRVTAMAVMRSGRVPAVLARKRAAMMADADLQVPSREWDRRWQPGKRGRGLRAANLFLDGMSWPKVGSELGIPAYRAQMIACVADRRVRDLVGFARSGGLDAVCGDVTDVAD